MFRKQEPIKKKKSAKIVLPRTTVELLPDRYHETACKIWHAGAVPSALLMLASNFPNRLFRAADAPSRMAPSRIVLVIPPL